MDSTSQRVALICCSRCHKLCMDHVTLPCTHNYCQRCMEKILELQVHCKLYYCTECFTSCEVHPQQIIPPSPSSEQIRCTYCDGLAKKTCVQCDSSFCDTHLLKHPSLPGHILIEPSLSLVERKCFIHKEILQYYCTEDGCCICTSCWAIGDHKGHKVISLREFAEKKKSNLRPKMERFKANLHDAKIQISRLQAYEKEEKKKAEAISMKVMAQTEDLRTELNTRRSEVLSVISKQKKLVSLSVSNQIKKLETHNRELSRRMNCIAKLCIVEDPIMFLQNEKESNISGNFTGQCKTKPCLKIDKMSITHKLHKELLKFADGLIDRMLKDDFPKMKNSKIELDEKTAHYSIVVTYNLRGAFYTSKHQRREPCEERFKSRHVISKRSFSSGNHYWEVDVVVTKGCIIGVACHSMERKRMGSKSRIGFNNRSWSLCVDGGLSAYHNGVQREISTDSHVRSFGIFLEYRAGRLSFYQLCDPIRHLHTFTANFIEPLHAAFYLDKGSSITIRK